MDWLFIGAFQVVVFAVYVVWFISYTVPSSQQIYTFDARYEPLSMSAVSLGLFVHSLLQEDVFVIPMVASVTGVLAWVQLGTCWNDFRLNPDANQNLYRNVSTNPNAGATVTQYNIQIALTTLCFFAIVWMQAYWLYRFIQLRVDAWKPDADEFIKAWQAIARKSKNGVVQQEWYVSDGYMVDAYNNLWDKAWSRRIVFGLYLGCVVTIMIIALVDYVLFFTANAGQQYLGPIPNSQFGVFFAAAVMVRPIGAQPFATPTRFAGRFGSWVLGFVLFGIAAGISANNVVVRQQYTANQANSVPVIIDKGDCYLSDPCYQTLASSTTFYEFGTAVQYTLGYATTPTDWAYWSLFAVFLEITLFSLVTAMLFITVGWMGQEYADAIQTADQTDEFEQRLQKLETQPLVSLDPARTWAALRTKSFSEELVLQECKRRAAVIEPKIQALHRQMIAGLKTDPRFLTTVSLSNEIEKDPDFLFLCDKLGRKSLTMKNAVKVDVVQVPMEICKYCGFMLENTLAARSQFYAHVVCVYLRRL